MQNQFLQDEQTVLIIGSGPTGLIMAILLTDFGIPVRIIDRLDKPLSTSRAFTLHARTLELLEQLGLSRKYLEKGIKTFSMDYHFPGNTNVPKLDFKDLDSVYPFTLTIDQSITEKVLRDHLISLGVPIEWNTELKDLNSTKKSSAITLQHLESGKIEELETIWVIGCDGHSSSVRKNLNLQLDGSDYGGTMRMIDVSLSGFNKSNQAIHYFIAKDHMLLINKLPGDNYRVLISDKTEGVPPEKSKEAFQKVLDKHFSGQVVIGDPVWSTNFRISKRKVNTYKVNTVFLAGDAAHINSPAGGQGMNVAIQDAFNLGWKLALVIKGIAKESFLDSYAEERSPIAEQMLEGTNYIHSIIMAHGQGMEERIKRMEGGKWNKKAVNQIAGISYTYRNSDTVGLLAAGDRAPDCFYTEKKRVYDLFSHLQYTLLVFADKNPTNKELNSLDENIQEILGYSKLPITPYIIVSHENENTSKTKVITDNGNFCKTYLVSENQSEKSYFMIRPDCHIAYCGNSIGGIKEYIKSNFNLLKEINNNSSNLMNV